MKLRRKKNTILLFFQNHNFDESKEMQINILQKLKLTFHIVDKLLKKSRICETMRKVVVAYTTYRRAKLLYGRLFTTCRSSGV